MIPQYQVNWPLEKSKLAAIKIRYFGLFQPFKTLGIGKKHVVILAFFIFIISTFKLQA